jgi:Protein of unknown function (DUF3891)
MIVRREGPDLLLIRQPDHAALAGRLMSAWRADGFPDRPTRARVLDATFRHDTGWEVEDAAPRVDPETGRPYDFVNAPLDLRQAIWPRALDRLAPEDPYVAALVAQHALTVYRRYANEPGWRPFFTMLERRRDDLFADAQAALTNTPGAAPISGLDTFLADYVIVGLGDLLSLIVCNGWREPYLMERYQAILHGDHLRITPDPFDGASVPLDVEARRIPDRAYTSDADLRDTLAQAPIVRLTGVAVGAAPSIT